MASWSDRISDRNDLIDRSGRRRTIRSLDTGTPVTTASASGVPVVAFASNDYLGLSQHPVVVAAARDALDRYGTGSGAARLIVGARPVHDELEHALAEHHDREAVLLFPSGYQANLGLLTTLAATAAECVIYSDELNHASIIDGCRLASADTVVYRHGDLRHLEQLMAERAGVPAIVVTDAVFSMDGDTARLRELADLARHHEALLVVDEAHAVLADPPPPGSVIVGTMSKTLGAIGGYVAADRSTISLLTNAARSFIFTTAGAPADAAAALAAIDILDSPEGAALQARLRANVELLRPGHPSPIVPVLLGDEDRALKVAEALLERGLLVPAIRPPTVAPGTCRLRIAVSALHEQSQLARLRDTLDELGIDLEGAE